jgi:P27 family predicted phage terminase small subunit
MGRYGTRPQPTAVKIARGTEPRWINHAEPQPPPGLPQPPDWLSPVALAKWNELTPLLAVTGVLTTLDGDALARYCVTFAEWKKHLSICERGGDVLIVRDEGGRVRYTQVGPSATLVRQHGQTLHKLAIEFGLTPAARSGVRVADGLGGADPLQSWLVRNQIPEKRA